MHKHGELHLQVVILIHGFHGLFQYIVSLMPTISAYVNLRHYDICFCYARVIFEFFSFSQHHVSLVKGIFIPS